MKSLTILLKPFIFILGFVITSFSLNAQTYTFITAGTNTWTAPGTGDVCIRVYTIGGGGGGGGNDRNKNGAGAGGGGGYTEAYHTVTGGTTYTYRVGAGGNGGFSTANGTIGQDSWFINNTTHLARGGNGGASEANGSAGGGQSGLGLTTGTLIIALRGGSGGNGNSANDGKGGGGGASAGPLVNGPNGTNGTAAAPGTGATSTWGGVGGNGGDVGQNGFIATAPGCGGGGAGEDTGPDRTGGNGSVGRVYIEIIPPACPTSTTIAPSAAQSICLGSSANMLTATSVAFSPCGTAPAVQYQWYSNTTNSNTVAGATLIGGATSATYTPPSVSTGTLYYFCVAYAPTCGQTNANQVLASPAVEVMIFYISLCPVSTGIAPAGAQAVCTGDPTTTLISASTTTGFCGSPTIQYQWYSNTTNSNTIAGATLIVGATSANFTPPNAIVGTLYYFSVAYAADNGCAQTNATQSLATVAVEVTLTPGPCAPTVYTHPSVSLLSSYSGACPVSESNGLYYDDGDISSNYSHDINSIYRTFCPTTEGTCVNVEFTSFITSNINDYLLVQNGPAQNSSVMVQAPTDASGRLFGNLGGSTPFSFQSTNSSGCLTFRFLSNGPTLNEAGWAAAITNVACAEAQPVGNADCINATHICGGQTFNDISTGPGLITSEGCGDCLTGESYSNWYSFTIDVGGVIELEITPDDPLGDFDFTVFKGSCGGAMERCSFSSLAGVTGFANSAADLTEDVNGDSYVAPLNTVAGETYFLLINSWTAGGPGFNLKWDLTSGASLDCTPLPIELSTFEVEYSAVFKGTDLHWVTTTERDNDFFTVEKSRDGQNFEELFILDGAGNSSEVIDYFAFDPNVELGFSYYRLKQTDFNGDSEYTKIKTVNRLSDDIDRLTITPNPVQNSTDVFFNNYKSEFCTIKVTDSYGKNIYSEEFTSKIGGNTIRLNLSDYSKGIYFVEVVTNNKIYTDKIIKN